MILNIIKCYFLDVLINFVILLCSYENFKKLIEKLMERVLIIEYFINYSIVVIFDN